MSLTMLVIVLAISFAWKLDRNADQSAAPPIDPLTQLPNKTALLRAIDNSLGAPGAAHQTSACIVFDLDDFNRFNERWGKQAGDELLCTVADRIQSCMRPGDLLCRLDADAFAVHLIGSDHLTFDAVLAIAERTSRALSEPIVVDGTTTYTSATIGIALPRNVPNPTGAKMLAAAERARLDAKAGGRGTLQVYSPDMTLTPRTDHALADEVSMALDNGEITAWMQPQVSVDGSRIVGMEALARWTHSEKGPIAPSDFLPAINAAGRSERLSEVMLSHALKALHAWDEAGLCVPCVGVNFGEAELRSPRLLDKIKWELDRFDIAPDRLCVEVLENVVSKTDNDLIVRNIRALGVMGCRIDLDDFGTGNAAIASIRRFRVSRIKIDKSFVQKVDQDPEQKRMIGAILTLAQQLKVDVLAEGVETRAEQSALAQLGCPSVQGFGIGRPMPLEKITPWLRSFQTEHPVPARTTPQRAKIA